MSHFIPPARWEAPSLRPWGAAWPADADDLLAGLALLSAFRDRIGPVEIGLAGDGEAAIAFLLGALAEHGVDESALPDVGFIPLTELPGDVTPIAGVRDLLIAECRAERRPYHSAPGEALWRLAAEAGGRVIVICESLAGADVVVSPGDCTCVALSPLVRRQARRLGMAAIPPPPAARWLPEADVVVADGRRPADLALAAESGRTVAIAHAEALNPLALRALGLAAERSGAGIEPTPRRATTGNRF